MTNEVIEINGLLLPSALVAEIRKGTWRAPRNPDLWSKQFPRSEVVRPELYNPRQMKEVNAGWIRESQPIYLGQADGKCLPGDLDPARSLLIGELQPDAFIALDCRNSKESPSIVYLMPFDDGSRWMQVAPSIESFLKALELDNDGEDRGTR